MESSLKGRSDIQRKVRNIVEKLASFIKGDAKDARAFLNGNAGAASALSPRGRSQVERIRDAWQQRIGDIPRADKGTRSVATRFDKEVGPHE